VIVAAIAYLMLTGTQKTFTYYYSVGELLSNEQAGTGETIRVSGVVEPHSISRDNANHVIKFLIADPASGAVLPVIYGGMVPDMFKAGIGVVVEGRYTPDGAFMARAMLAKCPSKYEAMVEQPSSASPQR